MSNKMSFEALIELASKIFSNISSDEDLLKVSQFMDMIGSKNDSGKIIVDFKNREIEVVVKNKEPASSKISGDKEEANSGYVVYKSVRFDPPKSNGYNRLIEKINSVPAVSDKGTLVNSVPQKSEYQRFMEKMKGK